MPCTLNARQDTSMTAVNWPFQVLLDGRMLDLLECHILRQTVVSRVDGPD